MRVENIGFGNLKLKQNPTEFCYGIDAVILADFAVSICKNFNRAVDLGTGTGIIPFILSHKAVSENSKILGVDVQQTCVNMARESCRMNRLENRINFICADVSDIAGIESSADFERISRDTILSETLESGGFDIVTSNPPYVAKGSGLINGNKGKFIARQETTADVEDFIKAASKLVRKKGHFFMVHRPSRLVDIIYYCRKYMLEPKTLRFVSPRKNEAPNIVLIHCVQGGGKELLVRENMLVYDDKGEYSNEINKIYERKV